MSSHAASQPAVDILDEHGYAKLFRVNVRTVRRWIRDGIAATHFKQGRKRWWRREAILAHMAANESLSGKVAPPRTRRRIG
jgi:predicted site-specific integrase-resolvase